KYQKDFPNYSKPTLKKLSTELYNTLIKPAEHYIEKKQNLIIVPDGPLAFLPFDAICAGENIFKDKSITLTPSISVSIMTRNRNYSTDKQFLGFGGGIYTEKDNDNGETKGRYRNREFSPDEDKRIAEKYFNNTAEYFRERSFTWSNLSGAKDEVNEIGNKIFKNTGVNIYTGSDVTEKNLKQLSSEGKLLGYSSIHFSCHGYFNPEYPLYTALVFSEVSGIINDSDEDGYLTVEDASVLNIQADIVVLSACNTGMGKFVSGDGITGLTRAFQVAGANSVLVTLWEVDDEATKEFMISMYGKVKDGFSYREAVNMTKEEFRGTGKSDPYYWAGFVLYE
ncbi:MAG TPA: CHAT domain-containing protein, partial [Spirochaetota bacterium]|nr:CHAT domain-containing protein [Spirochaetota bacterium]